MFLICLFFLTLRYYFTVSRLVSAPAAIAASNFENVDTYDSSICAAMTDMGSHLLAQERQDAVSAGLEPSLLASILAHFISGLRIAYSEIHLQDDYSLVQSYFNRVLPSAYPDSYKINRARLLLPGPAQVENERDQASEFNALNYAMFQGVIPLN